MENRNSFEKEIDNDSSQENDSVLKSQKDIKKESFVNSKRRLSFSPDKNLSNRKITIKHVADIHFSSDQIDQMLHSEKSKAQKSDNLRDIIDKEESKTMRKSEKSNEELFSFNQNLINTYGESEEQSKAVEKSRNKNGVILWNQKKATNIDQIDILQNITSNNINDTISENTVLNDITNDNIGNENDSITPNEELDSSESSDSEREENRYKVVNDNIYLGQGKEVDNLMWACITSRSFHKRKIVIKEITRLFYSKKQLVRRCFKPKKVSKETIQKFGKVTPMTPTKLNLIKSLYRDYLRKKGIKHKKMLRKYAAEGKEAIKFCIRDLRRKLLQKKKN